MDVQGIMDVVGAVAQTNPTLTTVLAAVPVLQGLCGLLARWTKRSHPTQFNTIVSKIAAFPMPHVAGAQ